MSAKSRKRQRRPSPRVKSRWRNSYPPRMRKLARSETRQGQSWQGNRRTQTKSVLSSSKSRKGLPICRSSLPRTKLLSRSSRISIKITHRSQELLKRSSGQNSLCSRQNMKSFSLRKVVRTNVMKRTSRWPRQRRKNCKSNYFSNIERSSTCSGGYPK